MSCCWHLSGCKRQCLGVGSLLGEQHPPAARQPGSLWNASAAGVLLVSCFCLDHAAFCFHTPQTGAVLRPKPGARRSCWNPRSAWSLPGPVTP